MVHFAFYGYVLEEILVFYGYVLEEILAFHGYVLEKCRLFAPSNQSLMKYVRVVAVAFPPQQEEWHFYWSSFAYV